MTVTNPPGGGNDGVPDTYGKPGTLTDRLAYVRTVTGVDTDRTYADAYDDVVRAHARRSVLLRAGLGRVGPAVHRARVRRALARGGAHRATAPTLTLVR